MSNKIIPFRHPNSGVPDATERRIPAASQTLKRHPWIQATNQKVVLSADLDGALSYVIMHHLFGWTLAGLYDTYGIAMAPGVDIAETIGLDTELMFKCKHSVGHHFALVSEPTQLNVNYEAGSIPSVKWLLTPGHTNKTLGPYFMRKYNLALAPYLLFLFGQKLPEDPVALNLLLLADSTYQQFYNYGYDRVNPNPREHLQAMGMDSLIEYLDKNKDTLNPEQTCQHFLREVNMLHPNAPARIRTKMDREAFVKLIKELNTLFGFRPIPDSAIAAKSFDYKGLHYAKVEFHRDVIPEVYDLGLWSNAILYCNKSEIVFGITTDKPITKEYPELVSRLIPSRSKAAA